MVVRLTKQGMEQVVMACWTYFTARRSCVYGMDDCYVCTSFRLCLGFRSRLICFIGAWILFGDLGWPGMAWHDTWAARLHFMTTLLKSMKHEL